jgi:membrane-bound lytic murein transglycosylase D
MGKVKGKALGMRVAMFAGVLFHSVQIGAATPPNLAQEERFKKFGVVLNAWAESQIGFWRRIYSEYDSDDQVIHDSMNLAHVYAVARGATGAGRMRSEIRRRLSTIADRFQKVVDPARLSPEEFQLFQALNAIEDPRAYRFAAEPSRIRIQSGLKDRIEDAFILSRRYLKRMQEIMAEEGVPRELGLLPFVESAFNHEARSGVGAAGIWQFMPLTAQRDLRVTRAIDERYDPLKSTRAAARFLRTNHQLLGSWALAVMAYHHGPGLVKRAIARVGSRDPLVLIRTFKDPSFRFASRNYLFEFLAMCDFGIQQSEWQDPKPMEGLPAFITVSFPRKTRVKDLLQRYRLNERVTRILNPHFRNPIWASEAEIPAHYPVRMAGITLEEFRRVEYPR